jgi:hypothetical protein
MKIRSADLEWTVQTVEHKKHPKLVGATYKYHGWYDFSDDRIRVDLDSTVPRAAQSDNLTGKSRFAYSDETYRIVYAETVTGIELNDLDLSYMRNKSSITVFDLSADPRLWGVLPLEFSLLKNYTLADVRDLYSLTEQVNATHVTEDGRDLTRVDFEGYIQPACNLAYWLDAEVSNMPIRMQSTVTSATGTLTRDITVTWKWHDDSARSGEGAWLPQMIDARQFHDGDLEVHTTFSLEKATLNESLDDELFQWKGMALPDKFVVKTRVGNTRSMKQWNAISSSFGEWEATPRLASLTEHGTPVRPNWSWGRLLLISLNAVVVLILCGFLAMRWRHAHKG